MGETCREAHTLPYSIVSAACVFLYFVALCSTLLTLTTSLSCLHQELQEFQGITSGSSSFLKMSLYVYDPEDFLAIHGQPVVYLGALVFMVTAGVFFTNMLGAQLIYNYKKMYSEMFGYARMKRTRIVLEVMQKLSTERFGRLVKSMDFDRCLEFNEGDVGFSGGIQVLEPAWWHPTSVDRIQRVGGSTSPMAPWTEDQADSSHEQSYRRLEIQVKRMLDSMVDQACDEEEFDFKNNSSSAPSSSDVSDPGL